MKTFKRTNALVVLVMMLAMAVPAITLAGTAEGIEAPTPNPEIEITGTLDEIGDGYVVVDGNTITIGTGAEVKGPLSAGDVVKVHARFNASGDLVAREIEAADDDGLDNDDNANSNDNDNDDNSANDDIGDNDNANDNDDDDNANGNANDDDDDNANDNANDDDDDNANGNDNDDDDDDDDNSGGNDNDDSNDSDDNDNSDDDD